MMRLLGGRSFMLATVVMDKDKAQKLLLSDDYTDRLKAARFLANNPELDQRSWLTQAVAKEQVVPVKRVLTEALNNVNAISPADDESEEPFLAEKEVLEEREVIYQEALKKTTGMLLHEMRPIVGLALFSAEKEIANAKESETFQQLSRLTSLLNAFETWNQAARSPNDQEFDLSALIKQVVKNELHQHQNIMVELVGSSPFPIVSDGLLIELAFCNGLRNALEATEDAFQHQPESNPKVLVTWDETPDSVWVAILDRGAGMQHAYQFGRFGRSSTVRRSTKQGHLGMGLAVAHQAVDSLGGRLSLQPRLEGGLRYEFRWPKERQA